MKEAWLGLPDARSRPETRIYRLDGSNAQVAHFVGGLAEASCTDGGTAKNIVSVADGSTVTTWRVLSHGVMPEPVWYDRTWLCFDLETVGLDPATAGVVELGLVVMQCGEERARFVRRVNPGVPIDPKASAVNGITDADVAGCPPLGVVLEELERWVHWWLRLSPLLVGHNITKYDIGYLRAAIERVKPPVQLDALGNERFVPWTSPRWLGLPALDSSVYAERWGEPSRKLTRLVERWGLAGGKAHSAGDDACASGQYLWRRRFDAPWMTGDDACK